MSDRWVWVAVLSDGTRVPEQNVGTFTAIDRTRCVAVEVWPARGVFKRPVAVRVDPNAGERAVFFRRRMRTAKLDPGAVKVTDDGTLTVAGWEGPGGRGYLVARDDGTVEIRPSVEGA